MLTSAVKIKIDGPTVVGFQVFLDSQFVSATGDRD